MPSLVQTVNCGVSLILSFMMGKHICSPLLYHMIYSKRLLALSLLHPHSVFLKTLNEDSSIDKSLLCTYEEYLAFWKVITVRDSQLYNP
jgi:hypothetical protein